jgi:nitrite reductase (NADH) large subunit
VSLDTPSRPDVQFAPSPAPPAVVRAPRTDAAVVADPLVVIGNGMASHRLCHRLVESGAHTRYAITVFGEERWPAYDRVHLTDTLSSGRDEASLVLASSEWYRSHGIDLRLGDPIVALDRDARLVRAASGAQVRYERLVFATGSSAYVPNIEGSDQPGVLAYRTLADLANIRHRAARSRRAAVIGGGLLGLEAARALRQLGLEVTVVELAPALMASQLDNAAAAVLAGHIQALGVRVWTGVLTTRIVADRGTPTLHLADDRLIAADMVVIAAGIRPRSELAAASGLRLGTSGAIAVNDQLASSDPRVFAIGECASHRAQVYGLVAPGYAMADVLAANLAGGAESFTGADVTVRLKLHEAEVATTGDPLNAGQATRYARTGVYRLIRLDRGRLVGALGVGPWPEFGRCQEAVAARRRVWPWQVVRFAHTGVIWPSPADTPVALWSESAVVCNCLSVTRGQLAAAQAAGCLTAAGLRERTGAGSLCGSCQPLLAQFCREDAPLPPQPWGRTLVGASVGAVVAVTLVLLAAPVPYSISVQPPLSIDVLWRDGVARQISGFVLVALSAAAGLLTARKRWRILTRGSFGGWRAAHAVIGLLTLVALAMHSGLRLGHHLNLALMTSFLVLSAAGAAVGGLTAAECRAGCTRRRWRQVAALTHVLALWPLPVLLVFHVLAAYYF